MLRPDYAKWNQKPEELLQLSMEANNQRSRERYLALYMTGSGQSNATQWAAQIGRENQTVLLHNFKGSKWMREEVTQHYCHVTLDELRRSCLAFIASLNLIPEQLITRLWPHFELDPDVEKLRFSF